MKRFVNEVVLCFDADAAGQKAAERSLDALLQNDLIVRVAEMPAGEDPDSLVRREGKEAFESRIAGARDFFDYWIERETAGVDLASLGAKMQLARSLAETVSRVRDPLMRGEVASKVSARLGVAAQDFQSLLPKQRSESLRSGDRSEADGAGVGPRRHRGTTLPCFAFWHYEMKKRENFFANKIGAKFSPRSRMEKFLSAFSKATCVRMTQPHLTPLWSRFPRRRSDWSLRGCCKRCRPMLERWSKNGGSAFGQAILRRQLDVAANQIKLPNLSTGEIVNLQKQILDLQEQLHELSQPAGSAATISCRSIAARQIERLSQILNRIILARHSKHKGRQPTVVGETA